VKDGSFEQWTQGDGLADYRAKWVSQDRDGTIWAGLASGIARIRGREIRNIRRENGLFDANISAFVSDALGNFWVDSDRGIFRITRASLNDCADGKTNRVDCVSYDDPASVKPGDKYDQEQSACKTQDGRIWFPSSRGVIMIDPANVQIDRLPPPVHLESIRANGREVVETNGIIKIPPGRGELEFQYTALSYVTPRNIRFRYQLEGYDPQWVDAETRRLAAYNNLKPGRYTFRVVACNADNVWNVNGASVEIQLLPHFYQTAWFYLLNGALIVASLAGIYAWRVNTLKSRERILRLRVAERTAELSQANTALTDEVHHRKLAQAEIEDKKAMLEKEIEERKRMQSEIERVHKQLMDASREAGQAEVATSVLHNVGNVLNSVNVSVSVIGDRLRGLRVANLTKAAALLQEHNGDLGDFLTQDKKGRHLPKYLQELGQDLKTEQVDLLKELQDLAQNVEHIKEIVAMQQTYAKFAGVSETVAVADLMESAVKMHAGAYIRHGVSLAREFEDVPQIDVDKHKVLQILVNLLHNAKYACDQSGRKDKLVTLRIQRSGEQTVKLEVADNGVGISAENLTRIFSHGFTTRKNGHGFGLHSGALAAKELGGSFNVHSDGLGLGATFTLELPLTPPNARSRSHDDYDMAGIGRENA
jgi:signal transduction histidine kinase